LYADAAALRLVLGQGRSYLAVGLESGGEGSYLEACLRLASDREEGPILVAGPGSASGRLRLLVDPASTAALSSGAPIDLDRSLASRSSVLGLQAGPFSLFGIAEGRGPIAFSSRPSASEAGHGGGRVLEAAAGGCSLGWTKPGFRLETLAAASYPKAPSPSSGWRPDPYSSPALGSGASPLAGAAVIAEKLSDTGGSLAAVSGSYGRLAGPGLAFRLESRETAGRFDLRLRASGASPAYRALYGDPQERLAVAVAEARLAMRRATSVSASMEIEAAGQGLGYGPRWGESGALRIVLPLGIEDLRVFESKVEAHRSPGDAGGGSWALSVGRGGAEEGGSTSMGAAFRMGRTFEGLTLKLATKAAMEGGLPRLGLDLALELFAGGRTSSPVLATGGIGLEFPWGETGELELDADLPEGGFALEPLSDAPTSSAIALRLRYRASFEAAIRHPRFRKSAGPKASSIAQRAAS
jgi:hypothetical protein